MWVKHHSKGLYSFKAEAQPFGGTIEKRGNMLWVVTYNDSTTEYWYATKAEAIVGINQKFITNYGGLKC